MRLVDRLRARAQALRSAAGQRAAEFQAEIASTESPVPVSVTETVVREVSVQPTKEPVDNAHDLVVGEDVHVPAPAPADTPSLLRTSPFNFGFAATAGGLLALFLFNQIQSLSGILILLVLSLFLAIGLNPLVEWFMRRGMRRGWALVIVLLGVCGVVATFISSIAPVLTEQITNISDSAPAWMEQLQNDQRIQDLDQRFGIIDKVTEYVADADFGASVFGGALGVGLKVLSALTNTFVVLILMIYFLASLPSIKHAIYQIAPASRRPRVSALGDKIIRSTGAYVAGAFVVAVCAGVFTFIVSQFLGLGDYSLALGFIIGLLSLVPVVGALVAGAIMTLLALTVSLKTALIALIVYIAYQQFESYVISPRVMKKAVDMPGTVTVVAALVGGSLMGVIGALLAVPVAAALLMLHREVFLKRQDAR